MKFSEKVKKLRKEMKLSQGELAAKISVSARSVASYEAGTSYPRYKEVYEALAAALGVDVNYLRTEDEEFLEDVGQQFGSRGQRQATAILEEARQAVAKVIGADSREILFTGVCRKTVTPFVFSRVFRTSMTLADWKVLG